MAKWTFTYRVSLKQDGKEIGTISIAANDSVHAEQIIRRMITDKTISATATRID